MPRRGVRIEDRAARALAEVQRRGGAAALPEVLTSADVAPLLTRAYVGFLLRARALPGVQMIEGGVWRCDRDTFLAWLETTAGVRDGDGTPRMDLGTPGGGAVPGLSGHNAELGAPGEGAVA